MLNPCQFRWQVVFLFVVAVSFAKAWEEALVDCTNPQASLWAEYVCELESGPALQEQCHPRFFLSKRRKSRGLIVAFHGYTACPDSFESMVEAWVPAGFNVMIPLLVGNGRKPGDCADITSQVYNDFTVCVNENRIDGLPLSRQGYIDFVDRINAIVKQEQKRRNIRRVFATGLSQGGPLASFAVSTGKGLYSASLPMNGFFGFSSPATDRDFNRCIQDSLSSTECIELLTSQLTDNFDVGLAPEGFQDFVLDTFTENLPEQYSYEDYAVINAFIRKIMTVLAENFDSLPDNELKTLINEATLGWGDQCIVENENGRGGICSFRLRNLFAAHSFAMYAHRLTGSYRSAHAPVQFVSTERDGSTRNSLKVQAAQNQIRFARSKRGVSFCMHRIVPGCDLVGTGNECGVPHSMLSRSEQELAQPFELYWENDVQGNSTRYLKRRRRMGTRDNTTSAFTVRDDCVQLYPWIVQAPSLILPTFRGIWIRIEFDANVGPLTLEQQGQVAQLLFDALDIQKGAVVPTTLDVVSGDAFCFNGLVQDFYLEFPADQVSEYDLGHLEVMVMRKGYLDSILGTDVQELEIVGRRPRQAKGIGGPKKAKKRKSIFRRKRQNKKDHLLLSLCEASELDTSIYGSSSTNRHHKRKSSLKRKRFSF